MAYGYDAASRRRTMTVAGQADGVGYDYDAANRLTRITQGSTMVGLSYDPAGRRSTLTLPNGVTVIYGYDAASQLTGITYQVSGSTTGTIGYGYDAAGQRTNLTGTYARTGLPAAITSATYDANNRISAWNGTAWPSSRWDASGNLLTDGTDTYTWNARNQLTTISGGTTASFSYDAVGRRRSKTTSGTATSFLYDGLNAVQERVSGSVTANLLTGGLDEVFARTEVSTTRALLADALGSTVALVESGGSVATQYTYEPFGKTTVGGTASANPSQFTGRENDGTGLYYYRARYYSPTYQRFVSEDPLGFGGGDVNLYAYARSAPTRYNDPLGRSAAKPTNQPSPPSPCAASAHGVGIPTGIGGTYVISGGGGTVCTTGAGEGAMQINVHSCAVHVLGALCVGGSDEPLGPFCEFANAGRHSCPPNGGMWPPSQTEYLPGTYYVSVDGWVEVIGGGTVYFHGASPPIVLR